MVEDTSDRLSDGCSTGSAGGNTFFGDDPGSDDADNDQGDPGTGSGKDIPKYINSIIYLFIFSM